MNKSEFIKLQKDDLKTSDNSYHHSVLKVLEKMLPEDAYIKDNLSVVGMYDYMFDYAKKHKKNSVCCVDDILFTKLMYEYFDLGELKDETKIDTLVKKEVSLEDFF